MGIYEVVRLGRLFRQGKARSGLNSTPLLGSLSCYDTYIYLPSGYGVPKPMTKRSDIVVNTY